MDSKYKLVFQHEITKEIKTKVFTLYELMHLTIGDMLKSTCGCKDRRFKLIDKFQWTELKEKNKVDIYGGDRFKSLGMIGTVKQFQGDWIVDFDTKTGLTKRLYPHIEEGEVIPTPALTGQQAEGGE